jgi:hypothetical protein
MGSFYQVMGSFYQHQGNPEGVRTVPTPDLLPDRSSESTAQWLRAHPGMEIVRRGRASLYAEATTKVAPDAVQVANRWHLLYNLS